jgi:hypothetical protein
MKVRIDRRATLAGLGAMTLAGTGWSAQASSPALRVVVIGAGLDGWPGWAERITWVDHLHPKG